MTSGTNAVRYGTAKGEWFLNATVVLPSGEIIKTRQRSRKSSAGFDLTKLFIGAEGTLGIVTEATIKLTPLLPTRVAVCGFPGVEEAVQAVGEVINRGVPIREYLSSFFSHIAFISFSPKDQQMSAMAFDGCTHTDVQNASSCATHS
jgi:FAD/FMN-containing dehydrogenase